MDTYITKQELLDNLPKIKRIIFSNPEYSSQYDKYLSIFKKNKYHNSLQPYKPSSLTDLLTLFLVAYLHQDTPIIDMIYEKLIEFKPKFPNHNYQLAPYTKDDWLLEAHGESDPNRVVIVPEGIEVHFCTFLGKTSHGLREKEMLISKEYGETKKFMKKRYSPMAGIEGKIKPFIIYKPGDAVCDVGLDFATYYWPVIGENESRELLSSFGLSGMVQLRDDIKRFSGKDKGEIVEFETPLERDVLFGKTKMRELMVKDSNLDFLDVFRRNDKGEPIGFRTELYLSDIFVKIEKALKNTSNNSKFSKYLREHSPLRIIITSCRNCIQGCFPNITEKIRFEEKKEKWEIKNKNKNIYIVNPEFQHIPQKINYCIQYCQNSSPRLKPLVKPLQKIQKMTIIPHNYFDWFLELYNFLSQPNNLNSNLPSFQVNGFYNRFKEINNMNEQQNNNNENSNFFL